MPVPAGPLGSEYLLKASRNGGIGSSTIDKPDGQWVGYWHEQSGCLETVPKNALKINDDGNLDPITVDIRAFLGSLAGPMPGQQSNTPQVAQPIVNPLSGPVSFSMSGMAAMQPIKIGVKGRKMEEGFVNLSGKTLLDDDDAVVDSGKDSVLLSRSRSLDDLLDSILTIQPRGSQISLRQAAGR